MSPYRGKGRRGLSKLGSVGLGGFVVSGECRWCWVVNSSLLCLLEHGVGRGVPRVGQATPP